MVYRESAGESAVDDDCIGDEFGKELEVHEVAVKTLAQSHAVRWCLPKILCRYFC
jgi:hypothetical protein